MPLSIPAESRLCDANYDSSGREVRDWRVRSRHPGLRIRDDVCPRSESSGTLCSHSGIRLREELTAECRLEVSAAPPH